MKKDRSGDYSVKQNKADSEQICLQYKSIENNMFSRNS